MGFMDDVGAALTGLMAGRAHRGPIENRENEPWPGWMPKSKDTEQSLPQSVHPDIWTEDVLRKYGRIPEGPPTKMAVEAGIEDIHKPTDAEVLQHLLMVDYLNTAQGRAETEQHAPWLPEAEAEKGLSPKAVANPPLPRRRPTTRQQQSRRE